MADDPVRDYAFQAAQNLTGQLLKKLLIRLLRGGFRLTDLGVIHDENVICKIP